ncbi:telomere length regulation protein-domain-containing protein, partial [Parasitella parasitica]
MSTIPSLIEQLEQLDKLATSPEAQLDSVIECISLPIKWINETSAHQALVTHPAWKRHVSHVLKEIVPQWTFAFNSSTHKHLLYNTLYSNSVADSVKVIMARMSLPILLECLSATNQQDVSLDTLEIYSTLLKLLVKLIPLYGLFISIEDVRFFCSLICSIPGHLTNAFGIQSIQYSNDLEWYTVKKFYANLSQLCANNLTEKSVLFTQEMLGKMIRQGYKDVVVESIWSSSKRTDQPWAAVFEKLEIIASPEQVFQSMLAYARQTMLSKYNNTISTVAKNLAHLLFSNRSHNTNQQRREERIQEFLNTAIFKLAKSHWTDDQLARLVVSTAILAETGRDDTEEGKLSASAQSLVVDFAKRATQTWSDPMFIQNGSSREKYYLTAVILSFIAHLSIQDIQVSIMMETGLLNSVSLYFATGDVSIARIGAVMAEAVSSKLDKEKPLNTTLLDSQERLNQLKNLVFVTDAFNVIADLSLKPENDNLENQNLDSREEEHDDDEEEDELDPDRALDIDDEQSSTDKEDDDEEEYEAYLMEDESDDEGLKQQQDSKKQHKKPVFIRDVIRCLQDRNDPLKLEIGLNAAEQVIRRKSGVGTELSESSVELAKYIISFPETYEIDNFQALQRNSLVALMTAVPEVVCGFIIDEMYNRDSSDGQKQLILGSISLAVRELAGWPTAATEELSVVAANNEKPVSRQIGTPLFVSKKTTMNEPKRFKNRLSGLAGPVFFFPLLVGWWEGTHGLIKYWIGNNALLTERFIMTLNIILHSSTNTPDKRRIVKEYFQFLSSMKYASISTQTASIRKSMLLGIDTILNVCYSGQEMLLFQDYQTELYETKQWLEDLLDQADEPQLHDLTVSITIKLSQIALTATNSLVTQGR